MTDDEAHPPASFSFDVRFMRKGKHSEILWLPEEYHASIGLVVAYWGNFESAFDVCLAALIEGEASDGGARDVAGWGRSEFKRRRRLFKDICGEWLAQWAPNEAQTLAALCDTAGDLSAKRNLIAHGVYSYTIPAMSSVATNCIAVNVASGERLPFDEYVLKKIYHDIAHMTADLMITSGKIGEVTGPFRSLPDTELLRAYRETTHPWNPKPNRRTPPPESSQE